MEFGGEEHVLGYRSTRDEADALYLGKLKEVDLWAWMRLTGCWLPEPPCKRCGVEKALGEYSKTASGNPSSICRACDSNAKAMYEHEPSSSVKLPEREKESPDAIMERIAALNGLLVWVRNNGDDSAEAQLAEWKVRRSRRIRATLKRLWHRYRQACSQGKVIRDEFQTL